jgi:hypothetical protein
MGLDTPNDGVVSVTVSQPQGDKTMSADLPEAVAQQMMADTMNRHARQMEETLGSVNHVNNLARLAGFTKYNEIGSIEGRANSGVNATPIAGPTIQQP